MLKPVSGQASWPDGLMERYKSRADMLVKLRTIQDEISALELVMLMQDIPLGGEDVFTETRLASS